MTQAAENLSGKRSGGVGCQTGPSIAAAAPVFKLPTPGDSVARSHDRSGELLTEAMECTVRTGASSNRQGARVTATPVLGYASVPAEWEERGGGGLQRQVEEITALCDRRGLRLIDVIRERERRHHRLLERPGLAYALERVAAGDARGLVVMDLSRIIHSVRELGWLLEWLGGRDARFVAAVPDLDTAEEPGRLAMRAIVNISGWERQRLRERTRNGMRAARRRGPPRVADNPELRERIARMRAEGMTLQAIADQLNTERIPTVRGGVIWRPSSVQAAAGYQRPRAGRRLNLRLEDLTLPKPVRPEG